MLNAPPGVIDQARALVRNTLARAERAGADAVDLQGWRKLARELDQQVPMETPDRTATGCP